MGHLVAEPAGFLGLRIPLPSDEECRARGIEPVRFPPRETWTQAQRDAANRLAETLRPHVFKEALYLILGEIERDGTDSADARRRPHYPKKARQILRYSSVSD